MMKPMMINAAYDDDGNDHDNNDDDDDNDDDDADHDDQGHSSTCGGGRVDIGSKHCGRCHPRQRRICLVCASQTKNHSSKSDRQSKNSVGVL